MNDIKDLLERAVGDLPAPVTVPEEDILRGRRALRHHRIRALAVPAALVVAFGTVIAVGSRPDTPPTQHAVVQSPLPRTVTTPPPRVQVQAIRLVAYTGKQPSGYRVAAVPDGWEIQGADPFAMTIAPIGFADQQPASFVGKLVVMLRSADDTGTPGGEPVQVGRGTGYLNHTEGIVVLTYQDKAQHWIQLQVPPALHWSDHDVTAFGAGVEITRDAEPGRG